MFVLETQIIIIIISHKSSCAQTRQPRMAVSNPEWGWLKPWIPPIRPIISQHACPCVRHTCPSTESIVFLIICTHWRTVDTPVSTVVCGLEVHCHLFSYVLYIYLYLYTKYKTHPWTPWLCIGSESSFALANGVTCSVSKGPLGWQTPCVPQRQEGVMSLSFGGAPLASPWGRYRWVCRLWAWRRTDAPNTSVQWNAGQGAAATA